MKKIVSLILAMALMMSLAIPAFAATNEGGDTSIDVKAQYNGGATTPDKINVNVTWGAMEFTYNVSGTKDWDATKHEYVDNATETWNATGNTVTITNHSNVGIKADLSFAADTAYNTVTGKFDKAAITLATAVGTEVNAAPADTATLTLEGTLADTVTALTKVGTITVKIAKRA